jgi:hypothetical protein
VPPHPSLSLLSLKFGIYVTIKKKFRGESRWT